MTKGVRGEPRGFGCTYHLVATTNEHSHSARVGTLLNHQHLVPRRTERHLLNETGVSKLLSRQVLESGHNATVRGNRNELDLGTANPTYGGEVVLHEQVIGLVVKAPLTDDEVRSSVLNPLDHLLELLLLVRAQLLELLDVLNVKLVLRLRARGLERTREDRNLGVLDGTGHLGVGEVLVDDDTVDELSVLEGTSDLSVDLDELKVDVLTLEVGDREDSVDGNLGELVAGEGDDLGAKRGLGSLQEVGGVVLAEGNSVGDAVKLFDSDLTRLLVTVGDADGVDTAVEEGEGRGEESTGED